MNMLISSSLEPVNGALFGKKVSADVLSEASQDNSLCMTRMGLCTTTGVLGGDKQSQREKRRPCERGGREWSAAVTSQGELTASGSWGKLGRILP